MKINKKIIKKTFITFLIITIFYLKPFYVFFFFFLFIIEYTQIIIYLLDIYKNWNNYYIIKIDYFDVASNNFLSIWYEYSKLQAFKKIYLYLSKKKINFLNLFIAIFIFLFSIPYRVLKLYYYFIFENEKNFNDGLEILYSRSFNELKNLKIEILNKKIYLNCFTIGKLIKSFPLNSRKQDIYNVVNDLKLAAIDFKEYEDGNISYEKMPVTMAYLDKEKKNLIYSWHYAISEGRNTMHATSNIPVKLSINQSVEEPMPTLIKKNAVYPATIITTNISEIKTGPKYLWVPKFEVDSIKFRNLGLFELSSTDRAYMQNKHDVYKNIIGDSILDFNKNSLIKNLETNNYSLSLINSSNKDIWEIIDKTFINV